MGFKTNLGIILQRRFVDIFYLLDHLSSEEFGSQRLTRLDIILLGGAGFNFWGTMHDYNSDWGLYELTSY